MDALSHIRDDVSSKQASKKTDFTVDLLWWGSLRLAPIIYRKARLNIYACGMDTLRKMHHGCLPQMLPKKLAIEYEKLCNCYLMLSAVAYADPTSTLNQIVM